MVTSSDCWKKDKEESLEWKSLCVQWPVYVGQLPCFVLYPFSLWFTLQVLLRNHPVVGTFGIKKVEGMTVYFALGKVFIRETNCGISRELGIAQLWKTKVSNGGECSSLVLLQKKFRWWKQLIDFLDAWILLYTIF